MSKTNVADLPEVIIDLVIATCTTCDDERRFPLNPPLRGGEGGVELVAWLKLKLAPCACGGGHAQIKMRVLEAS